MLMKSKVMPKPFLKIKTKSNAYVAPLLVSKYSDEQLDLATQLTKLYVKENN